MKIAVLCGGSSEERHVSMASAAQVVVALRSAGHTVRCVDTAYGLLSESEEGELLNTKIRPDPPGGDEIPPQPRAKITLLHSGALDDIDIAFVALHGGAGEDGTIQAVLESAQIPYTGSGPRGCALSMDKDLSKRLFTAAGIRTPAWLLGPIGADLVERKLGFPVIVKPRTQGSTVGLSLVHSADELTAAYARAARYDSSFIVEKYIRGRELTVGILGEAALAVGEILLGDAAVFGYGAKYQKGDVEEIFPADVLHWISDGAKELALRTHRELGLSGYSRADFRLDDEGFLWCLEMNALPGLTMNSLLPRSALASGISFIELCERICQQGLANAVALKKQRNWPQGLHGIF